MAYEEHHTYEHPVESDEGKLERIKFLFGRIWTEGGTKKVRALAVKALRDLDEASHRQYRQAVLLEKRDATGRSPCQLARDIAQKDGGDEAAVDRLRHAIKRAGEARSKNIASGTWNPPPITNGSSVDKTEQDR
jgi:hypothetical protein